MSEDFVEDPRPDLGAETFLQREEALQALWAQGEDALELLREQVKGGDPEVAWRARQILRWVDLQLTPETPKEIVDLVEAYLQASTMTARDQIYTRLIELKAYQSLFRLPAHIQDEEVSEHLAGRVAELAGRVARELILEGKDEEALSVLERSQQGELGQLRWVSLASAMGLRDELWGDLDSQARMRFARWEGDFAKVRELATENHEVKTTLQLLEGDPLPFLKSQFLKGDGFGRRARLLAGLWEGRREQEGLKKWVEELKTEMMEGDEESAHLACQILVQAGYVEEILVYLQRDYRSEAFEYYLGRELIDEALATLDLQPGVELSEERIEQALLLVEDEWDILNEGCQELVNLGLFYNERGQGVEAEKIFRALLGRVAEEQNDNETLGFLRYLASRGGVASGSGAPELALRMAEEMKSEVFAPRSFLMSVFGENDVSEEVYSFVQKQEPEMAAWEQVRAVCVFFGLDVDFPQEKFDNLLESLLQEAQEENREVTWLAIHYLANLRGNIPQMELALKALQNLNEEGAGSLSELARLYHADGRYEEAAQLWLELLETLPGERTSLGFGIVSLIEAGREDEAEELLLRLEKLSLGDGQWMVLMSELWGQVGNAARSHAYNERALLLLPAHSSAWFRQLFRVADSARKAGQWKQAAACQQAFEAVREFRFEGRPVVYLDGAAKVEYSLGMVALEEGDEAEAWWHLERSILIGGHLVFFADETFLALRRLGRLDLTKRLWEKVELAYRRSLELYPHSDNTLNTSAWVASRAGQDLADAMAWSNAALKLSPNSSAYLDTKAEVFFAQGKRKKALKWSEKACQRSRGVQELGQLRVQYRHFRDDSLDLSEQD